MDRFRNMEIFVKVAEMEGFSAAARHLGISKTAASQAVAQLEEHLGTRLLQRTTRRIHLTAEGRAYHERCREILADVAQAEETLAEMKTEPVGLLRISAPVSFGHLHLAPALAEFLRQHPRLAVDMVMNDRVVDIVEEGFDLALRIGRLEESSLMARRLASVRMVVCASPDYLERHGTPMHPEALEDHTCLHYAYGRGLPPLWRRFDPDRFPEGGGRLRVNNGEALMAAAMAGLGLVALPTFLAARPLQAGHLVTVLEAHPLPEIGIFAVYPQQRHLSPKVRQLIDFLARHFGDPPPWEGKD